MSRFSTDAWFAVQFDGDTPITAPSLWNFTPEKLHGLLAEFKDVGILRDPNAESAADFFLQTHAENSFCASTYAELFSIIWKTDLSHHTLLPPDQLEHLVSKISKIDVMAECGKRLEKANKLKLNPEPIYKTYDACVTHDFLDLLLQRNIQRTQDSIMAWQDQAPSMLAFLQVCQRHHLGLVRYSRH